MDCDCKKSCQNWLGNVAVAKLKQLNWQITKPLETQKTPLMSKTWFSEKRQKKGTTSEDAGIKEIQREYRNVKYVKWWEPEEEYKNLK